MNVDTVHDLEIDLFIECIYRRYGYDFRHYAPATIRRRASFIAGKAGLRHISELIPKILHDEAFASEVISQFSITVTDMFRDPPFYHSVRANVVPYLKTFPFTKIWVAGCATGEEAYSLAILLSEENVYQRANIFATDINEAALKKAQDGIYPLKTIQKFTANYRLSGGTRSFSDYYHAEYDTAIIRQSLKNHLTFAHHNLVSDGVFSEAHLIFCRNVLIYFDRSLQNRVLTVLQESLCRGGFLCLGSKEGLEYFSGKDQFRVVDPDARIYQKRI